jgi:hypothetical protein
MMTNSTLHSRMMLTPSDAFLRAKWRTRTNASIVTETRFASLKHRSGYHVVGIVGFARAWSQMGLHGPALAQIIADARASICHQLADQQRRHEQRLVVASGATNEGVLQVAYEVCTFLNITAIGIAPRQALDYPLGQIDYLIPFGQVFGDESLVFVRTIDELIVLGGGPQSQQEVFAAAQANRPITVIQGFGGIADQLSPSVIPTARFVRRINTSR